ncbi:hypothetical protein F5X98DRAFT_370638 [Xylaria grammica]|nr:hypothetical protein F5X98DRAFT_370638 [Xylaria grammica]
MSDEEPEYQPLPWYQAVYYTGEPFLHYCEDRHNNFDARYLSFQGYDARVLKDRANRLREQSINNPTTAQKFFKYDFLTEFLLCDFENSSYEQICGTLEKLSVLLDLYFFDGVLTQGPEKLMSLRVYSLSFKEVYGYASNGLERYRMRVVLLLRDQNSGKLFPRASLIETLIHEMCHVFVRLFFNFCPLNDDAEEEVLQGAGHGLLWQNLFYNACEVMATWHPELSYFDHYPKISSGEPAVERSELKRGFFQTLDLTVFYTYPSPPMVEIVRSEWFGRTPGVLNPRFRRAVFLLQEANFRQFVFSRVPFRHTVADAVVTLNRLFIFGFLLPILWWYGLLGWALAALYYPYMVSDDETFIVLLCSAVHIEGVLLLVTTAWCYFHTWFPHRTSRRQPENSRARDYPVWVEEEDLPLVPIVTPDGELEYVPLTEPRSTSPVPIWRKIFTHTV